MTTRLCLVLLAAIGGLLGPVADAARPDGEKKSSIRLIPGSVIAVRVPKRADRALLVVATAKVSPQPAPGPEVDLRHRIRQQEQDTDEGQLFRFGELIPPPGDDIVRLSLKRTDDGAFMLFFDNGYKQRIIRYHALLVRPDGKTEPTTVCPAKPNLRTVEYWGEKLAAIEIYNLSFVGVKDDMSCRY
jgi:hypothetical protein